ncbi:GNAT family N-acetyltransferase [Halocynthiibacter namhaensis]|uniref:GNAT family N-acetyltransferase n=1 Tax=Halocynthiibacter namhaensis TaxID=1290553 RepID=UPI000579932F|nr:GNAT family protein [Halocynthiibacter namhaensis]
MTPTCTWPAPVTLQGDHVILAPLSMDHADDLKRACAEIPGLWYTSVPTPEGMEAEITRRLSLPDMQPFTVMTPDGTPVGMTTFMNIDAGNRRVEIGSTWYGKSVQRSGLNTEAKLLLLSHAFEDLNCIAVEFRTHFMNQASRAAIARLGAKQDGILRNHMVSPDGSLRDTVCFSIISGEWSAVRMNLRHKLERFS